MHTESVATDMGRGFQIREEHPAGPHDVGRWRVTDKDGYVCTAELMPRALVSTPTRDAEPVNHWEPGEILLAVAHAVEAALVQPPEKKPGETFSVNVTADDLYDANKKP